MHNDINSNAVVYEVGTYFREKYSLKLWYHIYQMLKEMWTWAQIDLSSTSNSIRKYFFLHDHWNQDLLGDKISCIYN